MPNIKSAKKRVKVNAVKAANNKAANSALKTAIKKANAAIESNAEDKDVLVKEAVKKIDRLLQATSFIRTVQQERRAILLKKQTHNQLKVYFSF